MYTTTDSDVREVLLIKATDLFGRFSIASVA